MDYWRGRCRIFPTDLISLLLISMGSINIIISGIFIDFGDSSGIIGMSWYFVSFGIFDGEIYYPCRFFRNFQKLT